jgi:hypothetical protein
MSAYSLSGFALLLVAVVLWMIFSFLRRRTSAVVREIPAFMRLNRALGVSVEEGTCLHVSLGRGELLTPPGSASFISLALLRKLVEETSGSDKPLIVTSGDGVVAILSQDTLQAGYRAAGAGEIYNPISGRLTGLSPFSYAAGAITTFTEEKASASVLFGHFGSEVALLTDVVDRLDALTVAASDDPGAQAVLYASVDDPLIGEEIFAAGAYAGLGKSHEASLQVQDVLRWIIIVVLLIGSAIKLVGSF